MNCKLTKNSLQYFQLRSKKALFMKKALYHKWYSAFESGLSSNVRARLRLPKYREALQVSAYNLHKPQRKPGLVQWNYLLPY